MGTLKPGATYVYESPDGGKTIYAREVGSMDRKIVGYTHEIGDRFRLDSSGNFYIGTPRSDGQKDLDNHILWNEIRTAAKTNPALQKAVDRAILIYRLSKDDPE